MSNDKALTKIYLIRDRYHKCVLEQLRFALDSLRDELIFNSLISHYDSERAPAIDTGWIAISSLSQLRAEVGGRFENLKKRWEAAGFPLRAHRGEELGDFTVSEQGWLELSAWLYKQGFENRLEEDTSGVAFSIRPLSGD